MGQGRAGREASHQPSPSTTEVGGPQEHERQRSVPLIRHLLSICLQLPLENSGLSSPLESPQMPCPNSPGLTKFTVNSMFIVIVNDRITFWG